MWPLRSQYFSASFAHFSSICKFFGQFQSNVRAWKKSQRCEAPVISMIFIEFRHHNISSFWGYGHSMHTTIPLDTGASTWARPVSSPWSARQALRWGPHKMTSARCRITQDGPRSPVLPSSRAITCCRTLGKSQHPSYPRFSICKVGMLSALKGVEKVRTSLGGRKEPQLVGYLPPQVLEWHLISVKTAEGRWPGSRLCCL